MSIVFDSNIWIALFNEDDSLHEQARQLFLEHERIHVPEYVILETTSVLQLRASKEKADDFARMVRETEDIEIIHISEAFFDEVLDVFCEQQKKLAFVDCALLLLSQNHEVHTFDRGLVSAIEQSVSS